MLSQHELEAHNSIFLYPRIDNTTAFAADKNFQMKLENGAIYNIPFLPFVAHDLEIVLFHILLADATAYRHACLPPFGVADATRTRVDRSHSPMPDQLGHGHTWS